MGLGHSPSIVRDGLVLYLDAANSKSYPGSGVIIYDLMSNYNSTMYGVTHNTNGYFSFAGTGERDSAPIGEYISLSTAATTTLQSSKPDGVTYSVWMRFTGDQLSGHGIFVGSTTINHMEYRSSNINSGGYWRTEAVRQNGYSFGGGGNNADGGNQLNVWFNLTIIFDNITANHPVRWYKNGNLFHTGYMSNGSNGDAEYFEPNSFGKSTGTDTYQYVESFKGDMSLLKIYEKALTVDEIKQNFNALRGRFGI